MAKRNLVRIAVGAGVLALNIGLGTPARADACTQQCWGNGTSNAYCGSGDKIKGGTCRGDVSPTYCWGVPCNSFTEEEDQISATPEF